MDDRKASARGKEEVASPPVVILGLDEDIQKLIEICSPEQFVDPAFAVANQLLREMLLLQESLNDLSEAVSKLRKDFQEFTKTKVTKRRK